MKTISKKIVCILLSLLLVGQAVVMLAACNKGSADPEKTPLTLSTDALDGVFNPFSYTSGADGGVVSQTQLGLLTIDETGTVVAGWDQPTVAEAYSVKQTGKPNPADEKDFSNYYTDYYIALKNGVKFSDGSEITIKDVLFNMYVYLDPVYTGSSTMYSIDIQGLSKYRTQSADDDAQTNTNQYAQQRGWARVDTILGWCDLADSALPSDQTMSLQEYCTINSLDYEEMKSDIAKIKSLFREELNTDWVAAATMIEEYEKYYLKNAETDAITSSMPSAWKEYTKKGNTHKHISEQWEVFAIMYGMITTATEQLGERGSDSAIKKYTFEYNSSDTYQHDQESMVNRTYMDFFPDDENGKKFKEQLAQVIQVYGTAGTFLEYAVNSEKEKILKGDGKDKLEFDHVEGIMVYEANSIPEGEISWGSRNFDGKRTILKIRINGVDPKALMSFSFSVAPMEYYSTKEAIDNFKSLPDTTEEIAGETVTVKNYTGFGVEYASPKFMDNINTNLAPRGAGPYRISYSNLKGASSTAKLEKKDFYNNNIVTFERNEYFETVMKGGHNAKIRFLRYKVIASNAMVDAVTGKNAEVHVSQPSATREVKDELRNVKGAKAITVSYMGYGYIGINASFVHELKIRQAIMHAMDVSLCRNYYGSDDLVSIIYRSMSKESDYYPSGATARYKFDSTGETSRQLAIDAGYHVDSKTGVFVNSKGEQLKFTFTVAGETEDHPAYQTMALAAKILNDIGFDITVTKDTQALSKLASGGLQIWAAAWSSAIDPDMYQVYHKDSTASSVKNWGYPYLLKEGTQDELDILDLLAEKIENGRKYMTFNERKDYYYDALDLVMELAVELPTYQRKEMYLINTKVVDEKTLCEANIYQSPLSKIWEVNYVGAGK